MRANFWLCALAGVANASMMERQSGGYEADPATHEGYPSKPYHAKPTGYASKADSYHEDHPSEHAGYEEDHPSMHDEDDYHDNDENDHYANGAARKGYPTKPYDRGDSAPWRPKTNHPEFFSIRIDQACAVDQDPADCPFDNFAIRLEGGIVIATPYNRWWDPRLPIFFVDDDTELYTVSKNPLQIYVDTVTGALRYAPVGWLPPNAIAFSFYKTGNNPLGNVGPSPAQLSWPSTQGNTLYGAGPWQLCPLGNTGQYQVFVNSENFLDGLAAGIIPAAGGCTPQSLAAINASPLRISVGL